MIHFKKIEEQLHNDWYNAQEDVDIDALINNIHPLDKKRKKGFFLWFLLGFILIAALSSGLLIGDKSDLDSSSDQNGSKSASENIGDLRDDKLAPAVTAINELDTQNSNKAINAFKLTKSNTNQIHHNIKNQPVYTPNSASKVKAIVLNDIPRKKEYQTPQKFSTSDYKEDALDIENQGVSSFMRSEKKAYNILSMNSLLKTLKPNTETNINWLTTIRPVECPSFNSPKWSLALGVEAGVFNPYKQLELLDIQQSDMYEIRNKDERSLEGLQGSIYAQIKSTKIPLYFKIGAMYSRFTEQLNLQTTSIEQDTTIGILSITQSQNGDTLTVIYGQIISDIIIEKQSVNHHYFNLIDIPLGVGYNFSLGKKLYLGLEAGVNFNIMAKAQGKILENSSSVGDVNQLASFRKKVGLNYYGSAIFGYNVKENQAIYLNGKFILNNHDYSSSTNFIGQKYSFAGLNIGYVYSF